MGVFKASLFAAVAVTTAVASMPALAGGSVFYSSGGHGVYGGGYYASGYSGRGFRGARFSNRRGFNNRRGFGRRSYRRGGGDAALIALGVIGGAIILNEVIEEDRRRDVESDRRYRDEGRYRRYDPNYDRYYYQRGYSQASADDFRGDEPSSTAQQSERGGLEDELLGGEAIDNNRAGDVGFSVQAAYAECAHEARDAASRNRQFIVLPGEPTIVEPVGSDMVRMTARLTAQDQRGRQFLSTLTCEADAERITFLQLS